MRQRITCNILRKILLCLFFLSSLSYGWAQTKNYATVEPSKANLGHYVALGIPAVETNSAAAQVISAGNAASNDSSSASLKAYYTNILGLVKAEGEAWIQLKFPDGNIASNTPVYIRIDEPVLDGVNVDLLGLIGDLTGLFSKELVEVEAYTSANASSDGTKVGNVSLDIVTDKNSNLYIRAVPNSSYNSIRVKLRYRGGLLGLALGASIQMNVYNAFVFETPSACDSVAFTDQGKTTGISVNLGDVVKNPAYAIDDNTSSYSEISTGTLNVLGAATQNIYFPALSEPTSTLKVRLGIESSALDLALLGAYHVKVYNGNTLVQTFSLQSGLINGLDLLGLLGNNGANTVSFNVTDGAYDRVEIGIFSTVGLNLAASKLRIYDVSRFSTNCPEPPATPNPLISPVCANANIVSADYVDDAAFAVDSNFDSYASIRSGTGVLLGLGSVSGHLEAEFDAPVPAGKTAYIRIDYDETVLKALLAGGLGNTVTGLVNGLLLGEHYFTVEAKSSITPADNFLGSSIDNFSSTNGKMRIVQDKAGRYYIAVKSDKEYDSIRITDNTNAVIGLLAPDQFLNVYSICYEDSEEICDPAFSTSYDGSGLVSLDLLDLGNNGVTNAQYAIDGDLTTKSQINLGVVNVNGSMTQFVNFNTLSNPEDHFNVTLSLDNGALTDVSLVSSIEIKAYAGEEVVFVQKLSEDILGLDLLGLLSNGQAATLRIAPGKAFDRVSIGKSSLVDVNLLSSPIYVHEVERFSANCPDEEIVWDPKTESPFNKPDCANELISFENVNFPYEAITDNVNYDTYATLTAGAGTALGIGAYSSHIELKHASVLAAHEVSYIRIETEGDLFEALLGGSLGNALGNVVGSVALGKQNIVVQALDASGNPVGNEYSSLLGFDSEFVKLVKDKAGKFYLAVTADVPYQAVRIEFHQQALLGLSSSSALKVYSMCRETEFDACEQAAFTSWESSGIALDIANLTNGGVANPEFAIDADNSNYSTLNLGVLGVGASVSQKLYFKTKSNIDDELRVRLQLNQPNILDVDLLGSSELIFYNGDENVKEMTLASGLINNLDLLGLFNSGGVQSFTFAPGVVYDRVELKIASLVAVGTSAPIRLYGMSRLSDDCPDPDFLSPNDVFKSPVCADGVEVGTIKAVDDVDFAIDGDYNSYATMRADAGIIFGINDQPSVLELTYGTPVAANTTSYLRIADDAGILESLLSGSIGELVYNLLNGVALGDNYFEISAKNADGDEVLGGSSKDGFAGANGKMKIVQDKAGRYYVAISPDADYSSVEIKAFSKSLLGVLANGYNLNVYGMCHETDFDGCEEGFSTSWDGSGLSVGVTGLGSYGVTDAFKALNNNNNSDYSTLSLGTLNVAGHIQQNIQYNKAVPANTTFRLKMEVGTGTVNVAVFDDIRILGYKSGVEVYNQPLQTAVLGGVSLGTLFNNGGAHDVSLALDEEIDEIALRINSLVNATVGVPDVRLYYITQDCAEPNIVLWKSYEIDGDNTKTTVSGGEEIEYTIHVRNIGGRDLAGFTVKDELPQGLTWVSGGSHTSGVISFSDVVLIDETVTFKFKAKVAQDLTDIDEIKNIAVVKLPGVDDDFESYPPVNNTNPTDPDTTKHPGTVIPVTPVYDFTVVKNGESDGANSNQAQIGDEITYTITVKNTGNKKLTNISVKDILLNVVPAEVSIVNDGGAIVNGDELSFVIADLAVNASASFTIITKVETLPATSKISNKAEVSFTAPDNTVVFKEAEFDMATNCNNIDATAIADITVDLQLPVCPGTEVELTAALSAGAPLLTNPVFKWYKNSNLSDTPQIGESISVIVNQNTSYYVTVEATGYCFTGAPLEAAVSVLPAALASDIKVVAPANACVGEEATFIASLTTPGAINNPVFKWYTDAALTELVYEGSEFNIVATSDLIGTHILYVTVEGDDYCVNAVGEAQTHTIAVNALPDIALSGGNSFSVIQSTPFNLPAVTSGPGAVITWYDYTGTEITNPTLAITIDNPGIYTYTVVAEQNGCTASENLVISVYDTSNCPPTMERVYATVDKGWGSIITGLVSATGNTVDGNPKTHSTLTTGVGLLGIGTVWQNVGFDHVVPAGTPVTIKLGKEYSGLMLAGGISVQGLNSDGSTIGGLKTVAGGLLDLLAADNVMEFTFVPSDNSGPKAYWGVRISQGSLLSVAQNAKVYGVYYTKEGTVNCNPIDSNTKKDVLDVLHGVEDIGLGVASATASVVNPWDAVDNDLDTYALISRGVAVLNRATLTVVFKQQATPGDELQIITEIPGNPVLSLELIKGYTIQRYLGNEPVGPELDNTSSVLDLKLLGLGYSNKYKIIINPVNEPYDRVKISYGSVVGVLGDFTRIYDVSLAPKIDIPEADQPVEVCLGKDLIIPITDACTTYVVYTSETGTEVLITTDGFNFEVPKNWAEGTYTLYVQAIRNGCEIGSRVPVQIEAVKCSKDCIISNPMITNKIKK